MSQENTEVDPFEQYRTPIKEEGADYSNLRVSELAYLQDHDALLATAISTLITKYKDLDDYGVYLTLNSASNAYLFFDDNLEGIIAHEEKDIIKYLYETEISSWTLLNHETAIGVLDQLKHTYGNSNIWNLATDLDQDELRKEVNTGWDDLYELTCDIWNGAHEEWADTSDVSGVELSLQHDLFTSCPRSSYQEAMRWVAHRPENEGPARDFIYLMMGVFELAWVDFLKHPKEIA